LFAGSDSGGERAAAIDSLIGTAKLNGLDPEAYLCEVLQRVTDHPINWIEEPPPWNLVASAEAIASNLSPPITSRKWPFIFTGHLPATLASEAAARP